MFELIGKIARQLPSFRGKYRLIRFLLKQWIASKRDILIKTKNNIYFLLPNINEAIGFSIFINGVYEKDHINYIIDNLPLNSCFVDVGANIGTICIPVAKKRPDVKVIAVEASSKVFR